MLGPLPAVHAASIVPNGVTMHEASIPAIHPYLNSASCPSITASSWAGIEPHTDKFAANADWLRNRGHPWDQASSCGPIPYLTVAPSITTSTSVQGTEPLNGQWLFGSSEHDSNTEHPRQTNSDGEKSHDEESEAGDPYTWASSIAAASIGIAGPAMQDASRRGDKRMGCAVSSTFYRQAANTMASVGSYMASALGPVLQASSAALFGAASAISSAGSQLTTSAKNYACDYAVNTAKGIVKGAASDFWKTHGTTVKVGTATTAASAVAITGWRLYNRSGSDYA